jgi:exonuclease-1
LHASAFALHQTTGRRAKQQRRLRRARQENKQKAAQHLRAGNLSAAYECYQRAVDVTPAMAKHLVEVRGRTALHCIALHCMQPCMREPLPSAQATHRPPCAAPLQALKAAAVQFIVAPYEADAQMAYLARRGDVHAVITEDSDLLVYGCPRVRAGAAGQLRGGGGVAMPSW